MKYKILLSVILFLFLLGALGSLFLLLSPKEELVKILSDGKVVRTIDLSCAEDETFVVAYEGRTNTIEIKNGAISVIDADCPDHTCMKMGKLSSSVPIVCLPNRLVIKFEEKDSDVDTLTR